MRLNELEQRLREQQEAERLLAEFCKRQGKHYDFDELEALHQELEARIAALSDTVSSASEQRMTLRQELEQLQSCSQALLQRAPVWLAAQSSLNQLSEQCGEQFESSQKSLNTCSSCWSASARRLLSVMKWARASVTSTKKLSA